MINNSYLKNRVILMIGAGRYPGPGIALALASLGATVATNDLSPILLDPLHEAALSLSGTIKTYVADATKGMPLRAMLDEVMEDWGRIDVLINNPRVLPIVPLLDMDEWDWQRTMDMNLNGPFLVSKLVSRFMFEQGQGTIINIVDASEAINQTGSAAYAASQTGLLALSKAAARELIAYNIRVYTLCPDRNLLHNSQNTSESVSSILPKQAENSELAKMISELCSSSNVRSVEETIKVSYST
ncbi:MAG: SDR family NAD(P)-dependent oxidoreductase [Anaerolineaceae bacterium]|nr:SDR family NAD(P)-dependent oxidoreductase [Anaerolineaceae bacterium]